MTTPTWEPVGQEVLQHAADPLLSGALFGRQARSVCAELLSLRALLAEWADAADMGDLSRLHDVEARMREAGRRGG